MAENELNEQFQSAVYLINALPRVGPIKPTIKLRLKLYGLYKVATEGKNNTPKPPFFKVEKLMKWNSWTTHERLTQDEAKYQYIKTIGNELRNIYFSGLSDEMLAKADMAWLDKLNNTQKRCLFNGILNSDEVEEELKEKIESLRKVYAPDMFDNI